MGQIYFVRHGQSRWNVENKICGVTDIELTEGGREQAAITGRLLLEEGARADEILYSPLSRAAETARIISELTGIPAREEKRLIEHHFGTFEATPRYNEPFLEATKDFFIKIGGGETTVRMCQRIYNLLDELTADPGKSYILVSHNGTACAVNSYFHEMTNQEFWSFGLPNCSYLKYDF